MLQVLHPNVVLHPDLSGVHQFVFGKLFQAQCLLKLSSSANDPLLLDIPRQLIIRLLNHIVRCSPAQKHIKDKSLHLKERALWAAGIKL